jgi:hypothetical protein
MVCNSGYATDDSVRERRRVDDAAKKHLAAVEKLAGFLRETALAQSVTVEQGGTEGRAEVAKVQCSEGVFLLMHRGYCIKVSSANPLELEKAFRKYCAEKATHITVQPRINKAQLS